MGKSGRPFEEIGARLADLRAAMGYAKRGDQASFAAWLGFTSSQWNNWEGGSKQPALGSAIKICQKTGATLDWIYRGERSGLPVHLSTRLPDHEKKASGRA